MNYKLTIQYDGTDFQGWQIQEGYRTVQGELTRVLTLLDSQPVKVHGSGRTDAGVHAEGQVASAKLSREFTSEKLRSAINGNLSHDVRVIEVSHASENFHARYSAKDKTYVYRILNTPYVSPFWFRYAHQESRPLDLDAMKSAAELFLGKHDWTAFCSAEADAESRVRTLTRIDVEEAFDERAGGRLVTITATADGFLRYMVRSIVGTLLAIGRGEARAGVVLSAFETGNRALSGATAPAKGLTLLRVRYD